MKVESSILELIQKLLLEFKPDTKNSCQIRDIKNEKKIQKKIERNVFSILLSHRKGKISLICFRFLMLSVH